MRNPANQVRVQGPLRALSVCGRAPRPSLDAAIPARPDGTNQRSPCGSEPHPSNASVTVHQVLPTTGIPDSPLTAAQQSRAPRSEHHPRLQGSETTIISTGQLSRAECFRLVSLQRLRH